MQRKEVHMSRFRREMMTDNFLGNAKLNGSTAKELDVLFASNDGTMLAAASQDNWPSSGWTPIGIVIVPGSHNRYGDNSCGVMSLKRMSLDDVVNGVDGNVTYLCFCPTDKIFSNYCTVRSDVNADLIPYKPINSSVLYSGSLPWPYEGTVDRIKYYRTGNPSTVRQVDMLNYEKTEATSDFNGIRNSLSLYLNLKSIEFLWTRTNFGSDNSNPYCYPAITTSLRFKTVGTNSFIEIYNDITSINDNYGTSNSPKSNKGYWYLPGIGELAYVPPVYADLVDIFNEINSKYNTNHSLSNIDERHERIWSSTGGHYSDSMCLVIPGNGELSTGYTRDSCQYTTARAFLRF